MARKCWQIQLLASLGLLLVRLVWMYFPCLCCRQEEVLGVVDLVASGVLDHVTVPVFKPIDTASATEKRLAKIVSGGGRFALIVNSDSGKPPPTAPAVEGMITGAKLAPHAANIFPAFELRAGTPLADLSSFTSRFVGRTLFVIHRHHVHSAGSVLSAMGQAAANVLHLFIDQTIPQHGTLGGLGAVLLRDDFKHHAPNGTYPASTHFGNLPYQYGAQGFRGFGDFATVGDRFTTGGGPARHVALHLTYPAQGPTIHCLHFVSSQPGTPQNTQGKYLNAVAQLVQATGTPPAPPFSTVGVKSFHTSHVQRHFPGLGQPKRWSLMHHIETMQLVLRAANAVPFI